MLWVCLCVFGLWVLMLVLGSYPVQPPPLMKMMMLMIKKDPPKHQRYRPSSQPFLATDLVVSVPLSIHVCEKKFIGSSVEYVSTKLRSVTLHVCDYPMCVITPCVITPCV